MAETTFPPSHTTGTGPSPTRSTRPYLDIGFVKILPGILKVAEIVSDSKKTRYVSFFKFFYEVESKVKFETKLSYNFPFQKEPNYIILLQFVCMKILKVC